MQKSMFLCIDLKSFYASVECVERGFDPMTTNLVVADPERSKNTICLAITPAMKKLGIRNRCRVNEIPANVEYITAQPRMQFYIDYAAEIYGIYLKYTIVLDQYLLHEAESGRRRFTLAHEAGHYLLCRHNPEQTVPSYRRTFDAEREYTKQEIEEMFSLNEFWADKMAACLLMPDFIVKKAVNKYYKNKKVAVYGNSIFASKDKIRLRKMADEIGVSFSALIIRLKHLD